MRAWLKHLYFRWFELKASFSRFHQVKIRGYRVEPGEIETVIGQHAAVRKAAVVVRTLPTNEKQLVAYFVPSMTVSGIPTLYWHALVPPPSNGYCHVVGTNSSVSILHSTGCGHTSSRRCRAAHLPQHTAG